MSATAVATPSTMWPSAKERRSDGLVAFDACHRRTLAIVGALEDMVATLDRAGPSAATCAEAASIAEFLSGEARAHHEHEERFLFPALLRGADPSLMRAVRRLHEDHDRMEEAWMELEPHVQAIATGFGTWDRDVLREGVCLLAALQRDHIEAEESLIYPELRKRLGSTDRRVLGRSLAKGERIAQDTSTLENPAVLEQISHSV